MDYEEILKTMSRWMEAYKPICDKDDSPLFQLEPPCHRGRNLRCGKANQSQTSRQPADIFSPSFTLSEIDRVFF